MFHVQDSSKLTPKQFELAVRELIRRSGIGLQEFKVNHLDAVEGTDGNYTMDITARFMALNVNFLVLIECKRHKNPIERSDVQILQDKIRSVGAQKGMIFSASEFQRGAVEYASLHGIALIQLVEGDLTYFTKSFGGPAPKPPPWADLPVYAGYFASIENGSLTYSSFPECAKEKLNKIYDVGGSA